MWSTPVPARPTRRPRCRGRRRRRRDAGRGDRVRGVAGHHPVGAQPRAAPDRRRGREARRRVHRGRVPQHRQAGGADGRRRRSRPTVDQIRFFAGAARMLEGRSAGEYMTGHTSMIRREPIGVCAQVTPVELPDDDGGLEVRARPSRRATRSCSSRPTRRRRPRCCSPRSRPSSCRRACSTSSAVTATRAASWSRTRRPGMVSITGRVRAGMEVAARGRRRPEARAPRARRQGAGRRVRRRRRRRRRRGHRRSPATSTPARTAPRRPG